MDVSTTALLLADLQNDFIHANGAYRRAGQSAAEIQALPARIAPLRDAPRAKGGLVIAAEFTIVAGRAAEPMISPHLNR